MPASFFSGRFQVCFSIAPKNRLARKLPKVVTLVATERASEEKIKPNFGENSHEESCTRIVFIDRWNSHFAVEVRFRLSKEIVLLDFSLVHQISKSF